MMTPDALPGLKAQTLTASRWWLAVGFTALYALAASAALPGRPWPTDPLDVAGGAILAAGLIALSVEDTRRYRLPDPLVAMILVAGLVLAGLRGTDALLFSVVSALGGGALLGVVAWLYRRWRGRPGLGAGDVKLLAAVGSWVGASALAPLLLVASASALVAVLALMLSGRRLDWTTAVPFGPFLAWGTWIVWLAGPV